MIMMTRHLKRKHRQQQHFWRSNNPRLYGNTGVDLLIIAMALWMADWWNGWIASIIMGQRAFIISSGNYAIKAREPFPSLDLDRRGYP